ncbi:MAG: LysM peptidoglycan-binding domain-containing protein [Clostridia bacterium]|nr:LysM peptidoglycan-binding domain-containing protein [Clostridia bacterium]
MTNVGYIGNLSPILNDDWTDHVPSYHSYLDFHKRRKAAKKRLMKERMVFFTVCTIMVCLCLSYFTISSQSSETYVNCPSHAVSYGETLWSIANEYKDDNCSTGEFIYKIKKANNLTTSSINAGDVLVIPTQS